MLKSKKAQQGLFIIITLIICLSQIYRIYKGDGVTGPYSKYAMLCYVLAIPSILSMLLHKQSDIEGLILPLMIVQFWMGAPNLDKALVPAVFITMGIAWESALKYRQVKA